MTRRLGKALSVLLVLVPLSACASAGGSGLAADDAAFAGLPVEVVEERLADPVLLDALDTAFAEDQRPGVVQLNVATTVYCRALVDAYTRWIDEGLTPTVPDMPRPDVPEGDFDDTAAMWLDDTARSIGSGDPEVLRTELLAQGGCRGVTVAAGGKETIADALGDY